MESAGPFLLLLGKKEPISNFITATDSVSHHTETVMQLGSNQTISCGLENYGHTSALVKQRRTQKREQHCEAVPILCHIKCQPGTIFNLFTISVKAIICNFGVKLSIIPLGIKCHKIPINKKLQTLPVMQSYLTSDCLDG